MTKLRLGIETLEQKTMTRNLRIREDTAKYLLNLDTNSAHYDAKSRSMRENPNPNISADKQIFKGDNFVRLTGDTLGYLEQERFAWEAVDGQNSEVSLVFFENALTSLIAQLRSSANGNRDYV